ncbi:MAG: tyrosine-type recombinase/integrase [Acidimicrobiia bacterium]
MLVSELGEDWLALKREELSAGTLYTYERIMRTSIGPAIGQRRVRTIEPFELQAMLMTALRERSINEALKTRAVLKGLFGFAEDLGIAPTSPALKIRLPRGVGISTGGIHEVPSPAEARQMSDALPRRYKLMPVLAAFAGLRWQEVAALKEGDFDLPRRILNVERAVGRNEQIKTPKSAAGVRKTVWAAEVHDDIEALVATLTPGEFVFLSPQDKLLHYPNWRNRLWVPACSRAGLSWTFHQFRHTFAVESLRRGRSVQSVASMMGHANPRVTWEVYAGLFEDHLDEAKLAW